MKEKLNLVRQKIDMIDDKLLLLFQQRVSLLQEVVDVKSQDSDYSFLSPEREAKMMKSLISRKGSISEDGIRSMWRLMISMSLKIETNFAIYGLDLDNNQLMLKSINQYFSTLVTIKSGGDLELSDDFYANNSNILVVEKVTEEVISFLKKNSKYKIFAEFSCSDDNAKKFYAIGKIRPENLVEAKGVYFADNKVFAGLPQSKEVIAEIEAGKSFTIEEVIAEENLPKDLTFLGTYA
jgi:chorismate mutase